MTRQKNASEIDTVYPELRFPIDSGRAIKIPAACPVCGAKKLPTIGSGRTVTVPYACGGKYSPKPQCQSHTDVFWGQCGDK